jgi:hypothetical protein
MGREFPYMKLSYRFIVHPRLRVVLRGEEEGEAPIDANLQSEFRPSLQDDSKAALRRIARKACQEGTVVPLEMIDSSNGSKI